MTDDNPDNNVFVPELIIIDCPPDLFDLEGAYVKRRKHIPVTWLDQIRDLQSGRQPAKERLDIYNLLVEVEEVASDYLSDDLAGRLSDLIDEMGEPNLMSAQERSNQMYQLIANIMPEWHNITNVETGDILPHPKDDPTVIRFLSQQQLVWLGEVIKDRPNSTGPRKRRQRRRQKR